MRLNRRAVFQGLAASSLAASFTSNAYGQSETWPSRPIRWLVGVPPRRARPTR